MKKVSLILSLVLFMFLGGCLSKKTEQQLNEVPGNNGGTPGVTNGDYVFKNPTVSKELSNGLSKYMTFDYSSVNSLISTDKTEGNGKVVKTTSLDIVVPYIVVSSYEGVTVKAEDEIKKDLNSVVPSCVIVQKSTGKIKISTNNKIGTYTKGEITKNAEKYFYYTATFTDTLLESGVSKEYSFLITSVTKTETSSDLVYFEDIVRTIKPGVAVAQQDLTKQSELIKKLVELDSDMKNYLDSSVQQQVYEGINNFFVHVEANYNVPWDKTKYNTKREATYAYIQDRAFEYLVGSKKDSIIIENHIASLYNKVTFAQLSHLEGEIAKAQTSYDNAIAKSDVHPVTIGNLSSLEESLNALIESRIKEDTQKGYNYDNNTIKEIAISQLKNISSSGDITDNIFLMAVKYIVIGNLEEIRVKGLGWGTFPNQGYQAILTYEKQLEKVVMINSYKYYEAEYFLAPKTLENGFKEGYKNNVRDYMKILSSYNLYNDTITELGANKLSVNDVWTDNNVDLTDDPTVKDVFNAAKKAILSSKINQLNISLNDYFNKIKDSNIYGNLDSLSLGSIRENIKASLSNLVNSVKIYDSYDKDNKNILSERFGLTDTEKDYVMTLDNVTSIIKEVDTSLAGLNYSGDTVNLTNGKAYIDIYNIAKNKTYEKADKSRYNYRVKVAIEILNNREQYVKP